MSRNHKLSLILAGCLCFAATAQAQNPEEGDTEASLEGNLEASASTTVSADSFSDTPTASNTDTDDEIAGDSDHSKVVGTFGVGFFGTVDLPLYHNTCAAAGACGPADSTRVSAPTIGARYWLSEQLAVEAAIGIAIASTGSDSETGGVVGSEDVSGVGIALHGAVPLALADSGHFVFQVVPQLNMGFTTGSISSSAGGTTTTVDNSGFLFGLGAAVGAEIHFGFMDLPNLSLQGNVGLMLNYESWSQDNNNGTTYGQSGFDFSTGVGNDPWDIVTGNVNAIYYF